MCYRAKDRSPEVRHVGASLLLAGAAACGYHTASPGGNRVRLRSALRKLDHWTVSLTSAALVRASGPQVCSAHVTPRQHRILKVQA